MRTLFCLLILTGCGSGYNPFIGPTGSPGAQGATGNNGQRGEDGAIGPQGTKGDTGTSGTTGAQGIPGLPGSAGQPGLNGAPGSPGLDATPVTVVKFCSQTAVYPSTFPEYGICLGGQIYAVYSANGGFLALIPPGTYSSNAINSACTFVVEPGCLVHQ